MVIRIQAHQAAHIQAHQAAHIQVSLLSVEDLGLAHNGHCRTMPSS